jgi:hypothetical protein
MDGDLTWRLEVDVILLGLPLHVVHEHMNEEGNRRKTLKVETLGLPLNAVPRDACDAFERNAQNGLMPLNEYSASHSARNALRRRF